MRWSSVLIGLYVWWHMWLLGGAQKFEPLGLAESKAACVARVAAFAPYEKKHGPLVWYADRDAPSHWRGCWPEDFDPRD
jgi:hypothetical protein